MTAGLIAAFALTGVIAAVWVLRVSHRSAAAAAARPLTRLRHRPEMAWRSDGETNEELVRNLRANGQLTRDETERALLRVNRANYAPAAPYDDSPQPIGQSQTISAPHMHAMALDYLGEQLTRGAQVLDVGSGSGILTAAMGHMVAGDGGHVFGIDVYPALVEAAKRNIQRDSPTLLDDGVVSISMGDGWRGLPDHAPFDAIHVGAAAESLPQALVDQLKPGGRMFIPVGPQTARGQELWVITKNADGSIDRIKVADVRYVPLVRKIEKRT